MAYLIVKRAGNAPVKYVIARERTIVGRQAESDLVLDGPSVSGFHAVLIRVGLGFEVEDLGSMNGTSVDGHRITKATLSNGSELRIGEHSLTLAGAQPSGADPLWCEPLQADGQIHGPATGAFLRRANGLRAGQVMAVLNKVVTSVGSPDVCAITFIHRHGQYLVRFSEGRAKATLNSKLLTTQAVPVCPGDLLTLGTEKFEFLINQRSGKEWN